MLHVPVRPRTPDRLHVIAIASVAGGAPARSVARIGLALAMLVALVAASGPAPARAGTSTTLEAACGPVNLRTAASTSAAVKHQVAIGTNIIVSATVSGGPWSATCAGRKTSGSTWYRITAIDGRSVSSLVGTSVLYGATGLFTAVTPEDESPTAVSSLRPGGSRRSSAERAVAVKSGGKTRTGAMTEGIDVSHWQGVIDWAQVRAAGKRFAYIKASEDIDFVDDRYEINRTGAKAAGLFVGAYHFAQPDAATGDAIAEADHFVDTAQVASGDLAPVLDLERTGGLSSTALQAWAQSFLERVHERTGVRGVIYVSPNFWKTRMADTTWFAENGYPVLWVAHWTSANAPSTPAGDWGSRGWTFWQYSSEGSVPGITGRVDLDRMRGVDFSQVVIP